MTVTTETAAPIRPDGGSAPATLAVGSPAKVAAVRVGRAALMLGALGLGVALFVIVRLFETWRIGPHVGVHDVSILGARVSYPAANVDALIILSLAFVGFLATAITVVGAVRELVVVSAFIRKLASTTPARLGGAFVIDDDEPRAFCAGLLRPRVYVSTGAIALLDSKALEAVLLHEHHHASRRDPLRLAAARVLARALFFLPWLGKLHRHEQALAELGADESALTAAPENRAALARAMLGFTAGPSAGIDPVRVDYVLGESPSWSFPVRPYVASLAALALIVGLEMLAGHVAAGTATFALPVLSSEPCVVMLAAIPTAAALLVIVRPRRWRQSG